MKMCATCKGLFEIENFEVQTTKDGLSNSCRKCLQSSRAKGHTRIPDGAICNPKRMTAKILNYDFNNVPDCYHELIHEQRSLIAEMKRL